MQQHYTATEAAAADRPRLTAEQQALVVANIGLAGAVARRFSRSNRRERAELMGEALIGLCRAALDFDEDQGSFNTFGYIGAMNYASRYVARGRTAKRRPPGVHDASQAELAESIPSPGSDAATRRAIDRERREIVAAAIGLLPPRWREVVEAWMRDETFVEIARRMDVSPERVRGILRQAHARLRPVLGRRHL